MTQLTLKKIPLDSEIVKRGDAVLAQWDVYDIQNESGWEVVQFNKYTNEWCPASDWTNVFKMPPSRVFELPDNNK